MEPATSTLYQFHNVVPMGYPGTGFVLYWDGAKWRNVLTPPGIGTLTSVFGSSPNDVWAVGLGPTVIHWDGISWVSVSAAVNALGVSDLFSVFMLPSGTDGWAVGDGKRNRQHPLVRHLADWGMVPRTESKPAPPGYAVLRAVSLSSSTFGWIVGTAGQIFRWDGLGWNLETTPVSVELLSVFAISGSDAWAVGVADTIIRWNGASWTGPMVAPTSGVDYHSIKMVSPTDGWIAGTIDPTSLEGTLLRWNGVAWTITRSFVTVNLNGLFLFPGGTVGTAVGDAETIIHWDGMQWNAKTSPTSFDLNDVFLIATNDGWAVGEGGNIYRWNGQSWHHYETLPSGADLWGLFMTTSSDAWAVGGTASVPSGFPPTILRWNGVSWTVVSPPGVAIGQTLNDVHMLSATKAGPLAVVSASTSDNAEVGWNALGVGSKRNANGRQPELRVTCCFDDGWAVGVDRRTAAGPSHSALERFGLESRDGASRYWRPKLSLFPEPE